MPNERDTKFAGFAKLLYEELAQNVLSSPLGLSHVEAFKQEQYQIIARRAYDLVAHLLMTCGTDELEWSKTYYLASLVIDKLEDVTEWPKQSE